MQNCTGEVIQSVDDRPGRQQDMQERIRVHPARVGLAMHTRVNLVSGISQPRKKFALGKRWEGSFTNLIGGEIDQDCR